MAEALALAHVIVDVAVWGLDRELTYAIPERFAERITVGSIVRVPLRNRRVRGWVVGVSPGGGNGSDKSFAPGSAGAAPLAIFSVSGRGPVFDESLLQVARGLARRYVHPLCTFLSLFTPVRLGRPGKQWRSVDAPTGRGRADIRLVELSASEHPASRYIEPIEAVLSQGRSAIVVVPEVIEGSEVLDELARHFPKDVAMVHSGLDPAERAGALWAAAEGKRRVVLGGRAAVFAPIRDVGTMIIHQEHDRSLKEQRSPYYDAREVAVRRVEATGGSLVLASRTPSLWSIHRVGLEPAPDQTARARQRAEWPAVEVIDPAKRGIPRRAIAAIIEARARGRRVLLLLPRVKATRAGPGPDELVKVISRVVPGATIAVADRPSLGNEPGRLAGAVTADVLIATEAGLAEIRRPSIAVGIALGVDSYLQRPSGTAAEETFAALWALGALAAGRNPRGRLILETDNSHHYLIQALARGDYRYFARFEMQSRQESGSPPCKTLAKLQVGGDPSGELLDRLRALPDTDVLGPVPAAKSGSELLLRIDDLEPVLDPLGNIVRSASERILVEMDPRDW